MVGLAGCIHAHYGTAADGEGRGASLLAYGDSLQELTHIRAIDGVIRKRGQAYTAIEERRGDAVLHAELSRQACVRKGFLERHERSTADRYLDSLDVRVMRAVVGDDLERGVEGAVRGIAARVALDADAGRDDVPWITEPREGAGVEARAAGRRVKKAALFLRAPLYLP